jgi:hypothetical protein
MQDNYVYLGKCPGGTCPLPMPRDCKGIFDRLLIEVSSSPSSSKTSSTSTTNQSQTSASFYQNGSQQTTLATQLLGGKNKNALMVEENLVLDNPAIANILTSMYRVRVVLGYRRLYEWLVSEYNQVFKPWGTDKVLAYNVWPDEQGGGGMPLLPFDVENRGEFTKRFDYFKETGRHPTHILKDESYFSDVHIINQHALAHEHPNHEVDPLLQHLVCDAMPDATHSCHAVKNGLRPTSDETRNNSYMNFDYDRLAMAAFARGWINTTSSEHKNNNNKNRNNSRAQVVQRIKEFDNSNAAQQTPERIPIADYPHDCLGSKKLEVVRVSAHSALESAGAAGSPLK